MFPAVWIVRPVRVAVRPRRPDPRRAAL